jgi:MFS family permease
LLSEYKGIPAEAKLLIFLSFIPNVAIGFIYTDLSYFLPTIQGVPSGPVITLMGVTLVLESFPFGILADRYGRLKMLVLGNICASLSLIGFALTTSFAADLAIAVLEGTGEAAYAVSFIALIAEKAGDEKRTHAFSLLAFLGWVAGALGGYAISLVLVLQGFGVGSAAAHVYLYTAVGLLSLSITPLIMRVKEGKRQKSARGIFPRKSARVIAKFGAYSVLIAVGAGLFVPLMALWFSAKYGVPDSVSGLVLGTTNLLTAGVVFMSPRLSAKLGLVKATVVTQAASTAFMLAVPFSPNFPSAASIYLVRVFLMNLSNPLTQSLIMGLVSPEERGMASGVTAPLWRLPNALSATVGYSLISASLFALPFEVATVLYLVGIVVFWFLFKDAKLPEEAPAESQAPAQSSSLTGVEAER